MTDKLLSNSESLQSLIDKFAIPMYRLLHHLDSFIRAIPGELGPHFSELLREIFKGGPSITLSVKEDQLWKMVRLIFARGKEESSLTNSALLEALHELLLVSARVLHVYCTVMSAFDWRTFHQHS